MAFAKWGFDLEHVLVFFQKLSYQEWLEFQKCEITNVYLVCVLVCVWEREDMGKALHFKKSFMEVYSHTLNSSYTETSHLGT